MGRNPGEQTEQWFLRAAAGYREACGALQIAAARRGLGASRVVDGPDPLLDEAYDGALDHLDAADDERRAVGVARVGPGAASFLIRRAPLGFCIPGHASRQAARFRTVLDDGKRSLRRAAAARGTYGFVPYGEPMGTR